MHLIVDSAKVQGESSREYVYRTLRSNIMSLHLPPGLYLYDQIICEELGVSRTPVREAVFDLVEDHLIDVFPKKRSLISLIDFTLVHEGMFLKNTMDLPVLELACGTLTDDTVHQVQSILESQKTAVAQHQPTAFFRWEAEMNRTIYASVGMEHVWNNVRTVTTQYERFRYFDFFVGGMQLEQAQAECRRLVDVLIRGDKPALPALCASLVSTFPNIQPYILEEYRSYFRNLDAI